MFNLIDPDCLARLPPGSAVYEIPETRDSLLLQVKDPDNRRAWEEFVQIYRPVVFRVATARGLQHADALDLTQTVFLAIAKSIGRWEKSNPSTRFRHWLFRVAKNATINAVTRRPREQSLFGLSVDEQLEYDPETDRATESLLELEYRRQLYLRAAEQVRVDVHPDTWKAFELTAVKGMSHGAVAEELGKSIGTIYAARSRVMKRLSLIIADWEGACK